MMEVRCAALSMSSPLESIRVCHSIHVSKNTTHDTHDTLPTPHTHHTHTAHATQATHATVLNLFRGVMTKLDVEEEGLVEDLGYCS
jgi:hypothetical protein